MLRKNITENFIWHIDDLLNCSSERVAVSCSAHFIIGDGFLWWVTDPFCLLDQVKW